MLHGAAPGEVHCGGMDRVEDVDVVTTTSTCFLTSAEENTLDEFFRECGGIQGLGDGEEGRGRKLYGLCSAMGGGDWNKTIG